MNGKQVNIELLKAYINGELSASKMLAIDELLANNEEWRTVYEGLQIANEKNINTSAIAEQLSEQLDKRNSKTAKVIPLQNVKRWTSIAAAIIGIIVISYATVYFISPDIQRGTEKVASSADYGYYEEDAVTMIEPSLDKVAEQRKLSAKQSEPTLKEPTPTAESRPLLQPEDIQVEEIDFIEPQKQDDFLSKYGYYQIRYKASEGKNATTSETITQQAAPTQGLSEFIKDNERNYIARFPFNGKVVIDFTVDEKGNVVDEKTIESSRPEATEAVMQLIRHQTKWTAAEANNKPVAQRLRISTQFGNSIELQITPVTK